VGRAKNSGKRWSREKPVRRGSIPTRSDPRGGTYRGSPCERAKWFRRERLKGIGGEKFLPSGGVPGEKGPEEKRG